MKRDRLLWVKASLSTATLLLLGVPACGGEVSPSSGDGDGAGGVGTGGLAPSSGGADGLGTGGLGTGGLGTGGEEMAAGGAASGGTEGGTGGDGTGGAVSPLALPEHLSETGLFAEDMETLAPGVRPFRPRFALWTDGAEKRRWISIPEGEQIDTSDMDYWQLPIGTKLWKEFSRDGKRIETRLLERKFNGVWVMVAYQWRDDLSDADKVPALGVQNASGTEHDIPGEEECWTCHNQMPGRVLGFSAIQLAHDAGADVPGTPAESEWTLGELESAGLLTDAPPADLSLPGTEVEQAALSYLHVNCGHCHNPNSSVSGRVDMQLWLTVDGLSAVEDTTTYQTTVEVPASLASEEPLPGLLRITADAQNLDESLVYARFNTVGETYSMPPLGTEIIDPAGEAAIREWIELLAAQP
jgi:hypothetical protein